MDNFEGAPKRVAKRLSKRERQRWMSNGKMEQNWRVQENARTRCFTRAESRRYHRPRWEKEIRRWRHSHKFVLVKRNEWNFCNTDASIIERYNETSESIAMQQWEFRTSSARSSPVVHLRLLPSHKWNKYGGIVHERVRPLRLTIFRKDTSPKSKGWNQGDLLQYDENHWNKMLIPFCVESHRNSFYINDSLLLLISHHRFLFSVMLRLGSHIRDIAVYLLLLIFQDSFLFFWSTDRYPSEYKTYILSYVKNCY